MTTNKPCSGSELSLCSVLGTALSVINWTVISEPYPGTEAGWRRSTCGCADWQVPCRLWVEAVCKRSDGWCGCLSIAVAR